LKYFKKFMKFVKLSNLKFLSHISNYITLYCIVLRCIVWQAEKKVKELQNELDDLSQRLDEAGGATQAQVSRAHTST